MNPTAETTGNTAASSLNAGLNAGPTLGPSLLQAVAALLIVIGLIFLTAYLLRRFAFGGQLARTLKRTAPGRTLAIAETLWIDARHRLVTVVDSAEPARRYTLLLGPQQALQLLENPPQNHIGSSHGNNGTDTIIAPPSGA